MQCPELPPQRRAACTGTAEVRHTAASPQSAAGFSSKAAGPVPEVVAPAPARGSSVLLGKAPGSCARPPAPARGHQPLGVTQPLPLPRTETLRWRRSRKHSPALSPRRRALGPGAPSAPGGRGTARPRGGAGTGAGGGGRCRGDGGGRPLPRDQAPPACGRAGCERRGGEMAACLRRAAAGNVGVGRAGAGGGAGGGCGRGLRPRARGGRGCRRPLRPGAPAPRRRAVPLRAGAGRAVRAASRRSCPPGVRERARGST